MSIRWPQAIPTVRSTIIGCVAIYIYHIIGYISCSPQSYAYIVLHYNLSYQCLAMSEQCGRCMVVGTEARIWPFAIPRRAILAPCSESGSAASARPYLVHHTNTISYIYTHTHTNKQTNKQTRVAVAAMVICTGACGMNRPWCASNM